MNLSAGLSIYQEKSKDLINKPNLDQLVLNFFYHQRKIMSTLKINNTDKSVSLGNKTLKLNKQKKIFTIFSVFFNQKESKISKDQLISELYPASQNPEISFRQMNCYNHNTIKLISRARKIAQNTLGQDTLEIEWFPYSLNQKKWDFYQLSLTTK